MSMAKRGNSKVNSLRSDSMVETNMAAEVSLGRGSEYHAKNYATSVV